MPAWKGRMDSLVLDEAHLPRIKPEVEIYPIPFPEHEHWTH
jgi:hypothetical protein